MVRSRTRRWSPDSGSSLRATDPTGEVVRELARAVDPPSAGVRSDVPGAPAGRPGQTADVVRARIGKPAPDRREGEQVSRQESSVPLHGAVHRHPHVGFEPAEPTERRQPAVGITVRHVGGAPPRDRRRPPPRRRARGRRGPHPGGPPRSPAAARSCPEVDRQLALEGEVARPAPPRGDPTWTRRRGGTPRVGCRGTWSPRGASIARSVLGGRPWSFVPPATAALRAASP